MARKKKNIINNETIMLGLVVFVISMLGTLTILNEGITGFSVVNDTETGRVNVTIAGAVSITLSKSAVNFTGMEVAGHNMSGNRSGFNSPSGFVISNSGNVAIDINVSAVEDGSEMFSSATAADSDFKWNCTFVNTTKTSGSCNLTAPWTNVLSNANTTMISDLNYTDDAAADNDNATLNINVRIPSNEPTGTVGTYITFFAWQT